MWRDYSAGYIKNNRSSGLSIMIAAFISALLLSLLCGLFYNAWKYEVERIKLTQGSWQSRLVGTFDLQDMEAIRNFADVKSVVVNDEAADGHETVLDIYFDDYGTVLEDTPRIAEMAGVLPEARV